MSMLDRKLLRDLAGSWGMLLAIVLIMACGVTVFVAMHSVHRNLTQAKRDYYRQCRMADWWVDLKKAPLAELAPIGLLPGVRDLRARISFAATVDIEGAETPVNGLVYSLPNERKPIINDIVLRQGDYFTPVRRNEVIVNDKFARKNNLFPGSRVHLLLNNRREELVVVGTAISAEFTYLLGPGTFVPDDVHFGVFYLKQDFAEEVFDMEGAANQLLVRLAPESTVSGREVVRQIESRLDDYGVLQTTPLKLQSSNQFLSGELDMLGTFATIFPSIFLAVAAVVLNALMLRLARQQRTIVGTLKALGYSDLQVFAHYLKFGLALGIVGGLLGVLGSIGDTLLMTTMYRWFFQFPHLAANIHGDAAVLGIGINALCALGGTWFGAGQMLRLAPAAAMRPEPPKHGGAVWLEAIPAVWSRLSSGWRMTLRGLIRNRFRTAMGLFSAAMGASLLVNGFMLVQSTVFLIDFQFHKFQRSDVDLTFQDQRGQPALDEVRQLPGVDRAEPILNVPCTFVNGPFERKGGITGLATGARLTLPRNEKGEVIPIPATGVVLTRQLAEILHVQRGDTLRALPVKGNRRPMNLLVADVADSFLGMGVYANLDYLSRQVDEERVLTGAQLQIDGRAAHLRELYRELKQRPGVQSVNSRRDMVKNLTDTLVTNQRVMISIIVTFSGIVFFGTIVNASLINLAEQLRQVATFLALGYTPWQVGMLFLRESMLLTLLGTLLGIPGGYGLTWVMAHGYENEMLQLPITTAPWIYLYTIALAILFTLAAHSVVQWNVHRLDIVEGLKVKE